MTQDLLDFSFGLGHVQLAAEHLKLSFRHADDGGAVIAEVLRQRMPELRQLEADVARIIATAEMML